MPKYEMDGERREEDRCIIIVKAEVVYQTKSTCFTQHLIHTGLTDRALTEIMSDTSR